MGRILYFVEGWGSGGIESVMMSLFRSRAFQGLGCRFDLFCICDWNNAYDEEIERLGGTRTVVYPGERPGLVKKLAGGVRGFNRTLSANTYDAVHVNATNGLGLVYAFLARLHGVPVRVVHSHNSSYDNPSSALAVKKLGHVVGRALFGWAPTKRVACSEQAGRFLFGMRPFSIVSNGIDIGRFRFSQDTRQRLRAEWGIGQDCLVIGSLGRIDRRKNPLFQVEVFSEVRKVVPDAVLLMAGDGALQDEVRRRAEVLGVSGGLMILPATSHPEFYYSAVDAFIAPSITEGFGLVAIEAQCSGLTTLVSDAFPEDVCVTRSIRRLPLSAGTHAWAQELLEGLRVAPRNRSRSADELLGGPFDCEEYARRLISLYG